MNLMTRTILSSSLSLLLLYHLLGPSEGAAASSSPKILISEYLRGATTKDSSIELYNYGRHAYTFIENDKLRRHKRDGTKTTVPLVGKTIDAGGTLVIVNGASSLLPTLLAGGSSYNYWATGYLQIKKGEAWTLELDGVETDVVGDKNDVSWGDNFDLRRKSTFLTPSTTFDLDDRWDVYPWDDIDGLGNIVDDTNCQTTDFGDKVGTELTIHVSVDDAYWCETGTLDAPFKSIEAAQQALRTHRAASSSLDSVTVAIAAGTYAIDRGLVFTNADSSDTLPTTYRGIGNVVLSGGVDIASSLKPLSSNGNFKTRLVDQSAAPYILEADLSQLPNIPPSTFDAISLHGYSLESNRHVAPTMLYSQNEKMTLSRWPNKNDKSYQGYLPDKLSVQYYPGQVSYDTVKDRGYQTAFKNDPKYTSDRYGNVFETGGGAFTVKYGGRLANWNAPDDIYLDGVLGRAWEWTYNKIDSISGNTVRLTRAELSGILEHKASHFHFENIPEELDEAGEFYIDRGSKMLYFYPKSTTIVEGVVLATLTDTMVTIDGADSLVFDGIDFNTGRGNGIDVVSGENIIIQNSYVRNFGQSGIIVKGQNNKVANCDISSIGANGMIIDGGSDAVIKNGQLVSHDIVAANNEAIGNNIRLFALDQKSQVPGIYLTGVGNTAKGNEIYDGPHFGIMLRHSTDNTIEGNFIHDLPNYFMEDGGAVYFGIGKFPYMRGNRVVGNLIKNVPTNGVYVDNFSSGVLISENFFHNVGNHDRYFSAININGGGQNVMQDNVFSDVKRPAMYNPFAETNLFGNYINVLKETQRAFKTVGVANTDYRKYIDFELFLNYNSNDEFEKQICTAKGNVAHNDLNFDIDARAAGTGVIQPSDDRWVEAENLAMSALTTDEKILWDGIMPLFDNPLSSDWSSLLASVAALLPDFLRDIRIVHANGGSMPNMITNGSFDAGSTSPWRPTIRNGSKTTLSIVNLSQQQAGLVKKAMRISNRKHHSHSAKLEVLHMVAGKRYELLARVKTKNDIRLRYTYTTNGSKKRINLDETTSNGLWVDYDISFDLPDNADDATVVDVWFTTDDNSQYSGYGDIYLANLILNPL